MILSLDLATRLTGFCAGSGEVVPVADAFKMAQHGDDIGAMLDELDRNVGILLERFRPVLVVYEAPILPSGGGKGGGNVMGSTLIRRKLFNLGGHVEWMCHTRGIRCAEESVKAIKRELAGHTKASKGDMVAAATKVGVRLPEAVIAGREDAADAFGVWLLGLRHQSPALSARWDKLLWSSRGALL